MATTIKQIVDSEGNCCCRAEACNLCTTTTTPAPTTTTTASPTTTTAAPTTTTTTTTTKAPCVICDEGSTRAVPYAVQVTIDSVLYTYVWAGTADNCYYYLCGCASDCDGTQLSYGAGKWTLSVDEVEYYERADLNPVGEYTLTGCTTTPAPAAPTTTTTTTTTTTPAPDCPECPYECDCCCYECEGDYYSIPCNLTFQDSDGNVTYFYLAPSASYNNCTWYNCDYPGDAAYALTLSSGPTWSLQTAEGVFTLSSNCDPVVVSMDYVGPGAKTGRVLESSPECPCECP